MDEEFLQKEWGYILVHNTNGFTLLALNKDLAHNADFSRLAKVSINPALTKPHPNANITPPTFEWFHFCARITFAEMAHKIWNPFPLASSSPSPPPSLKPLKKVYFERSQPTDKLHPPFPSSAFVIILDIYFVATSMTFQPY